MAKWMIRQTKADIKKISADLNISETLAKIIVNRGIDNYKDLENFLKPDINNLHPPSLMKDMQRAVSVVVEHIKDGKKIAIYGDYDADGVMSSVILYKALKNAGANVIYYIPDRMTEGFGLNKNSVERLYNSFSVDLLFTCDNGIAAVEESKYIYSLGMKLLILDHHEPEYDENGNNIIPMAEAIVDPKQKDCAYPFKNLCAAGIAYKFAQLLYEIKEINNDDLEEYLTLAAIATVCDIVDLVDENRIIVKTALSAIKNCKNIGLMELIRGNNLDSSRITPYHIGFVLGPCINATGRLDSAISALELFITENVEEAVICSKNLIDLNTSRKNMTSKAFEQVCDKIEREKIFRDKIFVIYDDDIHESIAGIVAGRVKEKYNHPTIVLTKGNKEVKGSARSIEKYNVFNSLLEVKDVFIKFGGHSQAAGMSLDESRIDELRNRLNNNCSLKDEDFEGIIRAEKILPLSEVTFELANELYLLEPFGKGNKQPIFAEKNININKVSIIGQNKDTIKFSCVVGGGKTIPALAFNSFTKFSKMAYSSFEESKASELLDGGNVNIFMDFLYTININIYANTKTLQLIINDFRFSALL